MSRAFMSHIADEAAVARQLQAAIDEDFLGHLEVFVSSDTESIAAGENWLLSVEHALTRADLVLILCSPRSIQRPWINFEAGAAWMQKVPIIPLCHGGLTPRDLPMPLSLRHAVSLDSEGHQVLYKRVAEVIPCRVPASDFEAIAVRLRSAQQTVSPDSDVRQLLDRTRAISDVLREALESDRYKWRSLERIATEAAVTEEIAAEILRADPDVRFSKGKSGSTIVGLVRRVGGS